MELYKKDNDYSIYKGNSQDMLEVLNENSIDAIVTDPPYGLTSITKRFGKENSAPAQEGKDGSFARLSRGFMGKTWDGSGIEYNVEFWHKCFKVLKPGGYLLAFGGSRTFHRIACAIEDAGFEIRDTIMRLYGSGFPKSLNIGLAIDKKIGVESKIIGENKSGKTNRAFQSEETTTAGIYNVKQAQNQYAGYGTCLKPAYEPIIMARKPVEGSVADNMLKHGVGAINIDECRVGEDLIKGGTMPKMGAGDFATRNAERIECLEHIGRFPSNIITDGSDEIKANMPNTKSEGGCKRQNSESMFNLKQTKEDFNFHDEGSACRYFYCAKASKKDRDEGLDSFNSARTTDGYIRANYETTNKFGANSALRKNIHPTVKPTELMQYLVRLVAPKGSTILDPFCGSGSTGKACMFENRERNANYRFIGIEMTDEYLPIIVARIDYAKNQFEYDQKIEEKKTGQMSLFDFGGNAND